MTRVELSIKAKQLLDEGVMNNVFDALRQDILDELQAKCSQNSPAEDRENLCMQLQALGKLEMKFAWCCTQLDFEEFQKDNLESTNRRV